MALNHAVPDRIPIDFWASTGLKEKIRTQLRLSYDEFLNRNGVDFRYIEGPSYIGPALDGGEAGLSVDIWGVPRRTVTLRFEDAVEYYREVERSPLEHAMAPADIEAYEHWPSPDWFDYAVIEEQCDAVLADEKVVVFMGDRLNRIAQLKPAMYLCGVETTLISMAANPDVAHAVLARIRDFYLEYIRRILAAANGKIDIVATGDDFGAQNALLVSAGMWAEFLEDGFAAFVRTIHEGGARVMHHTCGSVTELIRRMIGCGLDILQSIQPEAAGMDAARLKETYGDALCFQGGVSIQRTMPYGSADNVRREVRDLARTMGRDGGYIFCTAHNIQADTPLENVQELLKAYHEFGVY